MFAIHSFRVRLVDGTIISRYLLPQDNPVISSKLYLLQTISKGEKIHRAHQLKQGARQSSRLQNLTPLETSNPDQAQHTGQSGP